MIGFAGQPGRRSGRLVTGLLAVGVGLAVGVAATTPATASAPTTLTSIDATSYRLAEGGSFATYQPRVDALAAKLGPVAMGSVLTGANRNARALCHDTTAGADGFCWDLEDDLSPLWFPQGISGSGDAAADGLYQGHHIVAVSWYNPVGGKGVRLSLVDRDDPAHTAYRHVLLVEPTSADNYRAVPIHAGGIAWYGNYLYVADTAHGLRVFDMRQLWPTDPSDGSAIGHAANGAYYAAGYSYVVPQVGSYTQAGNGDCSTPPTTTTAPLCFSSLSLDRSTSPPSLLSSEYYAGAAGARLVRWNLDAATGRLALSGGSAQASAAYQTPHTDVQGAVSYGARFLSTSSHDIAAGARYDESVGQAATVVPYPVGAESVSYWPATGQLWGVGEFIGKRTVFVTPTVLAP